MEGALRGGFVEREVTLLRHFSRFRCELPNQGRKAHFRGMDNKSVVRVIWQVISSECVILKKYLRTDLC